MGGRDQVHRPRGIVTEVKAQRPTETSIRAWFCPTKDMVRSGVLGVVLHAKHVTGIDNVSNCSSDTARMIFHFELLLLDTIVPVV